MGTIRLNMSNKEISEGYRAGIPEQIMAKMIQGMDIAVKEKEFVRSKGKAYVLGHTKYRGQTRIKPQLRDLPGVRSPQTSRWSSSIEEEVEGLEVWKPVGTGTYRELTTSPDFITEETKEAYMKGDDWDFAYNITKNLIGYGDDPRDWSNAGEKFLSSENIESMGVDEKGNVWMHVDEEILYEVYG